MGGAWLRVCFFLVICTALSAVFVEAESLYLFEVAENGETTTTINFTGKIKFWLPPDVAEPEAGEGVILDKGNTTVAETASKAAITYKSSYHTKKEQGVWHFEAKIPYKSDIILVLPQAVHVVQSLPQANFAKLGKWQLTWQNLSGPVTVSYVRVSEALAKKTMPEPKKSKPLLIAFFVVLIAIGLAALYFLKPFIYKKKEGGKPNITAGQLNVLRAANQNEALVLKIMLQYNGHIKRNQLERESRLSKSSLASTLKNLERKNILNIDRTFFVHYISLSQWFRDLK